MATQKDKVKEVTYKIRDGIKNVFSGQIVATALTAAGLGIGISGFIMANSAMMYAGLALLVLAGGAAYYSARTINKGADEALKEFHTEAPPVPKAA
jgi:hypothetical protein